jgi:hypothetical protein
MLFAVRRNPFPSLVLLAGLLLTGGALHAADEPAPGVPAAPAEFGKDVQLAPFRVNGKPLSVSIYARTKRDRRYGEKFADEVVEVAYETLGDTSFKGLVIVGADGEPHPIHLFRKFVAMSRAGQLDPSLAEGAAETEQFLGKLAEKFKVDDEEASDMGINFDTFLPAMPLRLSGAASRLYLVAWAEKFDEKRVEQKLRSLTRADFSADALGQYDWVFYVPPHSTTALVLNDLVTKAMKKEKMGMFKRGLVRTALLAVRPLINKAVEGMRKGMLFQAILHAKSPWTEEETELLARAYARELMPDLKPGNGDEKKRALAAIEKQKLENEEYRKDPFVKPARLETFDPAGYASAEGDYTDNPPELTHHFVREGEAFRWNYKDQTARPFYPAGDKLLVNEDGTMTIRFLVDDAGKVTGVEERWVRRRKTVTRYTEEMAAEAAKAAKDKPKPKRGVTIKI